MEEDTHRQPSWVRSLRPSGSYSGCGQRPCRRRGVRSRTAPGSEFRWCRGRSGHKPPGAGRSERHVARDNREHPAPALPVLKSHPAVYFQAQQS